MCIARRVHTHSLRTGVDTHAHTHIQLGCFSKGCLCKGSWILKLAAYFTFMKVGNRTTADMISQRSMRGKVLTFSYGSHYAFFGSLFIFTSSSTTSIPGPLVLGPSLSPRSLSFSVIPLLVSLVSRMLFVFTSCCFHKQRGRISDVCWDWHQA